MEDSTDPGLELESDPAQQRREWRVQRIAWAILYPLLLAIVFGLLGGGPLSASRIRSDDGALRLDYERFLRHRASDTLALTLTTTAERVEIRLDRRYLQAIRIEKITPEPERMLAGDDFISLVFLVRPSATVRARIEYQPQEIGRLQGWISIADRPRLSFSQFVYP